MLKKFINFYQSLDSLVFWPIALTALFACLITFFWGIYFFSLPPQLPLFYSLPWGENQLAISNQFLILPALIFLITLVNLIISWHLHNSQLVLKRVLAISSFVMAFLICVTALKILLIFI